MLRRNLISRAPRAAKDDRNFELAARHVKHLRCRVNDLIGRENRKIESHELDDRPQTRHRRAYTQPSETKFRDWCIDHALGAELFQQSARACDTCPGRTSSGPCIDTSWLQSASAAIRFAPDRLHVGWPPSSPRRPCRRRTLPPLRTRKPSSRLHPSTSRVAERFPSHT